MSIDRPASQRGEDGVSATAQSASHQHAHSKCSSGTEAAAQKDTRSGATGENAPAQSSAQVGGTSSSLLTSLLSPLSSLFQDARGVYTVHQDLAGAQQSAAQDRGDDEAISKQSDTNIPKEEESNKEGTETEQSQNQTESSPAQPETKPSNLKETPESKPPPQPVPYYTPTTTPTYKRLQKLRLSGTRTKQLIRAASRAHDDPPPPPELGACCGSSCDPCVNDLWREEREVWKERWGEYAVEGGGGKTGSLEW